MDVNILLAQAAEAMEHAEDQSQIAANGDFDREPPAAGPTLLRFIGYVELGRRPQRPYQGKPKDPADEVRLTFELVGQKHRKTIQVEGGGERVITPTISFKVAKKLQEKAGFAKLFRKMAYGRDGIKHMTQMLGEAFLGTVFHNEVEKDGKKTVYANLKDSEGVFHISAPVQSDAITGQTVDLAPMTPAPLHAVQLFLWANPTKEMWASLFIDGTREVKQPDGSMKVVSKNWLQESIIAEALNFQGSPLQAMLGGLGDLTLTADPAPSAPVASAPVTPAQAPAVSPAPTPAPTSGQAPSAPPVTAAAASPADVLAGLLGGL